MTVSTQQRSILDRRGTCRKCESDDTDFKYDSVFDRVKVTCLVCGFVETCLPADKDQSA